MKKQDLNLDYYFNSKFIELYDKLNKDNDNNLVIGGTLSLLLHDIEINTKPNDVDLILYNPTKIKLNY